MYRREADSYPDARTNPLIDLSQFVNSCHGERKGADGREGLRPNRTVSALFHGKGLGGDGAIRVHRRKIDARLNTVLPT